MNKLITNNSKYVTTTAEFVQETNYRSEADNSSKHKFGVKTNYGAKFV